MCMCVCVYIYIYSDLESIPRLSKFEHYIYIESNGTIIMFSFTMTLNIFVYFLPIRIFNDLCFYCLLSYVDFL